MLVCCDYRIMENATYGLTQLSFQLSRTVALGFIDDDDIKL